MVVVIVEMMVAVKTLSYDDGGVAVFRTVYKSKIVSKVKKREKKKKTNRPRYASETRLEPRCHC